MKSSTTEMSNQKTKGELATSSVMQAPTVKASPYQPAIGVPVKTMPGKTAAEAMHAAKGNDDTMSQPQASLIGKKTS